ncbi:MAG: GNAT family N-acetyltransferase [Actinomycetia bacterium]|nr:GNAT family N-acetyltransferase [Actinomycetes bacterium]
MTFDSTSPSVADYSPRLRVTCALPDELDALRAVRARVYLEEGFLEENELVDGLDVDDDDDRAIHLAVHEGVAGQIVGTARLIFRDGKPLPIEEQLGLFADSVNPIEISRLAVLAGHRSAKLSIAIWKAVFDIGVLHGADHAFAIIERPLLNLVRRFGLPFEEVGPPFETYHSINWPVRCDGAEVLAGLVRTRPGLVEFFDQHSGTQRLGDVEVDLQMPEDVLAFGATAEPVGAPASPMLPRAR